MANIVEHWHALATQLFAKSLLLEFHLSYPFSIQNVLEILIVLILFGFTGIGIVLSIALLFIFSPVIVPAALLGCLALLPFFALLGMSMLFLLVLKYSHAERILQRISGNFVDLNTNTIIVEGTSGDTTRTDTREIQEEDNELVDGRTWWGRAAIVEPEHEASAADGERLTMKITPINLRGLKGDRTRKNK